MHPPYIITTAQDDDSSFVCVACADREAGQCSGVTQPQFDGSFHRSALQAFCGRSEQRIGKPGFEATYRPVR